MPIYKKYDVPHNTQMMVWHITEDETALHNGIILTKLCINRLSQMKSDVHRCGFLSVRQLLKFKYTTMAKCLLLCKERK